MYSIEIRPSGYLLTFQGFIDGAEMSAWAKESRNHLSKQVGSFGVIVDMRQLRPLPVESQKIMAETQALYKQKGMQRSAVVLDNALTTTQFRRLAKESGIDAWERYIDATVTPKWSEAAVKWVRDGIEPPA
jgi:hypothetical protein